MNEPRKATQRPRTTKKPTKKAAHDAARKLFVLDTNVLMHDPTALFRFAEHDIYLPLATLEELDQHKKGLSEVARNVRQVSRELEAIIGEASHEIRDGYALTEPSGGMATGCLYFQTEAIASPLPPGLPLSQNDNAILSLVKALSEQFAPRPVILVSKDINLRIKARALGLLAQDYRNDKLLEDTDLLYSGIYELPPGFWETRAPDLKAWRADGFDWWQTKALTAADCYPNEFVVTADDPSFEARVVRFEDGAAVLKSVRDFRHEKNAVWGITARNREQNFALDLLMDPEVDLVTILGQAGTGKTLLTLAAGLAQTLDQKIYSEVIFTRATVPIGEDIGFLPGTEEEKMAPWMGALEDNLEVLAGNGEGGAWGRGASIELIRAKVKIKSINFMRGRTFVRKYLVLDEAQNLTAKQMRTLITRAGPGTKVICLGNLAQIDTPYLTEGSSGLTYLVERMKGWAHSGHVTLARGERSRLAEAAAERL
ncbi:MAG TPA: PhoH family protein [Hydrogenophilus thermoluteolus]|nr:PhoH family protein [Hydrogenophilus thermoluteolus]